jgi:hypothetical protein
MKFEKALEAFAAFLETLSVAMTAANSINPIVNFFRCRYQLSTPDDIFLGAKFSGRMLRKKNYFVDVIWETHRAHSKSACESDIHPSFYPFNLNMF